jgi:hypothetical protein
MKHLALPLTVMAVAIALCIGWILNIIAICHSDFASLTGVLVLRVVGIFLAPLGGIMGLFV